MTDTIEQVEPIEPVEQKTDEIKYYIVKIDKEKSKEATRKYRAKTREHWNAFYNEKNKERYNTDTTYKEMLRLKARAYYQKLKATPNYEEIKRLKKERQLSKKKVFLEN